MAIEDYLSDIQGATGGAKSAADEAGNYYSGLVGESGNLPSKLKEALGKKLDYNKDLITQKNTAMGDYFAAPATARDKYQNIWNPFEREKLVQQDKSQAMSKWGTFEDLIGQRMGQVSDIVGEGIQGWQSVVQAAQAAYQQAQQNYQNVLSEYMSAAGLQSQADERAMQQSQFDQNLSWDKEKFAKTPRGGSGGISGVSNADKATSETWAEIVAQSTDDKGNFDTNKAWAIINRDQGAMRNAGIDVQKLWDWQRNTWPAQQPAATNNSGLDWKSALNWNPYAPKAPELTPIVPKPGAVINPGSFNW